MKYPIEVVQNNKIKIDGRKGKYSGYVSKSIAVLCGRIMQNCTEERQLCDQATLHYLNVSPFFLFFFLLHLPVFCLFVFFPRSVISVSIFLSP